MQHIKAQLGGGNTVSEIHRKQEMEQASTGWKDVTVKLFGTGEQLVIPVMIHAKVSDLKKLLAEIHRNVLPQEIELVHKLGCSYKRHRDGDEIAKNVLVKGIKTFAPGAWEWPYPYFIVGAGHMGLRHAMHLQRRKQTYFVVERQHDLGGNAWLTIANPTSKLQTEGPQYQLQYDVFDGNCKNLLPVAKYAYWPTKWEIIEHFREICDEYGITPNIQLNCEAVQMNVHNPKAAASGNFKDRYYDMDWKSTKPNDESEGSIRVSCVSVWPGCLVVPHRNTWPGEEVFGGQIGYGFGSEFQYPKVRGQRSLIIGMGAFAHENVRTILEHGGAKTFNIARHFNLLMPRLVCWWINQSICPPTAAMVLYAMEKIYSLCGWDPWSFFSVTANADRTVASIKQYTRWGVSDIFFLACYFDRAEIIHGEVKRFKHRQAVLSTGRILDDIDHLIKVIGFDGDFSVDRLMQCDFQTAIWPQGDVQRTVMSDQSAVDASRFTNIAVSPPLCSMVNQVFHWHTHPQAAQAAVDSGLLTKNYSEPELGSPCYHWKPREMLACMSMAYTFCAELGTFEDLNNKLKKDALHWLADERKFYSACVADWKGYCKMFKDAGCTQKIPQYPYALEDVKRLLAQEVDLEEEEVRKMMIRNGYTHEDVANRQAAVREDRKQREAYEAMMLDAGADAEQTATFITKEDFDRQMQEAHGGREDAERLGSLFEKDESGNLVKLQKFEPGCAHSFEAARTVLLARARAGSPPRNTAELQEWLRKGHEMKNVLTETRNVGSGMPALRS